MLCFYLELCEFLGLVASVSKVSCIRSAITYILVEQLSNLERPKKKKLDTGARGIKVDIFPENRSNGYMARSNLFECNRKLLCQLLRARTAGCSLLFNGSLPCFDPFLGRKTYNGGNGLLVARATGRGSHCGVAKGS